MNLGLIGLGVMGKALARNIASHGFTVSVWNRSYDKIPAFVQEFGEDSFYAPKDFEDFVESLEKPRKVILMVPAGPATQAVIDQLLPVLEPGDCIMDGGNAHFKETEALQAQLSAKGLHFLGCGVSGGEEGALRGPSIMPGGNPEAWEAFEDVLKAIAAEDFSGKSCVSYMGHGGAGHYVKMVHNGIEYAEMQMLAEAYELLKALYKLSHDEIADIFAQWNEGRLASFLVEISVDILRRKEDGQDLLKLILDQAGQKGTGRWTSEEALALGVPVPSIAGAVFMRGFSAAKAERQALEPLYPKMEQAPQMVLTDFVKHLEQALFAARIANFEQGFALLRAANEAYNFGLNFPETVRIWQGGCIIRSAILKDMHSAFTGQVQNLYFTDFAHTAMVEAQKSWRRIVAMGVEHSIPVHVLAAGLTHFEASRQGRSSANFIQGLRDRFGSHTYKRVDKDGTFHTDWSS